MNRTAAVIALVVLTAVPALATTYSHTYELDITNLENPMYPPDLVDLDLYVNEFPPPNMSARLFDALQVGAHNVGTTWIATSSTDPAFSGVAVWLTDLNDDFLSVELWLTSEGMDESIFFAPDGLPTGKTVQEIRLTLDSWYEDNSGPNGIWTANVTVDVVTTPEPATMATLLPGILLMRRRRELRRRIG
ncbi:MAG: hypothetical protein JXA11_14255 [Phycisphaerae bacterium]|nr:hypothetical protein [Phycisphaerae bacterium]